jgi:hypothetical protein
VCVFMYYIYRSCKQTPYSCAHGPDGPIRCNYGRIRPNPAQPHPTTLAAHTFRRTTSWRHGHDATSGPPGDQRYGYFEYSNCVSGFSLGAIAVADSAVVPYSVPAALRHGREQYRQYKLSPKRGFVGTGPTCCRRRDHDHLPRLAVETKVGLNRIENVGSATIGRVAPATPDGSRSDNDRGQRATRPASN